MPENYYYCPDNFFKKMTDLESPRKNNDCYFYYYSTCAKGDNCTFRHEPSALGCETMCSFWKEGKCLNVHCNFRHMELRKNRKAIPCYWESQPGGCLKPHCPFQHQSAKPASADNSIDNKADSGTESADNTMSENLSHMSEKSFKSTPMDSLVVNFEEESDNESAPTNSPQKANQHVKVKTLEEIKLEKIQAEWASYYSYPEQQQQIHEADDLRQRILDRLSSKTHIEKRETRPLYTAKKRLAAESTQYLNTTEPKKQKKLDDIKIKTLEEIRAERLAKNGEVQKKSVEESPALSDSSVTSTNDIQSANDKPRKIKLQRKNIEPVKETPKNDEDTIESRIEASPSDLLLSNDEIVDQIEGEGDNINKTVIDEVLLLQDDDDNTNVSLKDEERLLNEDIDIDDADQLL